MTKGLNEQVCKFRGRSLSQAVYPVLWVDALYEKVRVNGRVVSMAVLVVCGVDEHGRREVLAVEPMAEESRDSYLTLFQNLKARGLTTPQLIISDANAGLIAAIRKGFPVPPGSGARCTLCGTSSRMFRSGDKKAFAGELKEIWLAPCVEIARKRAVELADKYEHRFSKAIGCLEASLIPPSPSLRTRLCGSATVLHTTFQNCRS
jgi:putative transposase